MGQNFHLSSNDIGFVGFEGFKQSPGFLRVNKSSLFNAGDMDSPYVSLGNAAKKRWLFLTGAVIEQGFGCDSIDGKDDLYKRRGTSCRAPLGQNLPVENSRRKQIIYLLEKPIIEPTFKYKIGHQVLNRWLFNRLGPHRKFSRTRRILSALPKRSHW